MVYLISINYNRLLSVDPAFCESFTCKYIENIIPIVRAWTDAWRPYCGHGFVLLRRGGWDVVMGIETQQQTGWAMDGRTIHAVMDTFRWDAGAWGAAGGRRYKK